MSDRKTVTYTAALKEVARLIKEITKKDWEPEVMRL